MSWSGTMFEYLMPPLLMREGGDSLIGRGCAAAIDVQIAYGRRRGVPWGISESGYHQFDAHQNYQYRAFGVPDLGFKRGLEDDLVIAPYACVLALPFVPRAALATCGAWRRSASPDATGSTRRSTVRDRGSPRRGRAVVRSFMAHHQGMILAALDNVLGASAMRRRFHAEPIVQTRSPLLFERPPGRPGRASPARAGPPRDGGASAGSDRALAGPAERRVSTGPGAVERPLPRDGERNRQRQPLEGRRPHALAAGHDAG
jgi:cyclic beta-1,2-glucan synthetase